VKGALSEARMRVPKMVKNGHNSVLHIPASAQEDSCSKKTRTDTKPKAFLKSWKPNKNHFRPISEQACALFGDAFLRFLPASELVRMTPQRSCNILQNRDLQKLNQKTFVRYSVRERGTDINFDYISLGYTSLYGEAFEV
jgi:hypothetical protein